MKRIKLANCNKYFIVDDEDYPRISVHKWFLAWKFGTPFSSATIWAWIEGKRIYLARFIIGETNTKKIVDHRDRNPLNNIRLNLRSCDIAESNRNRSGQIGSSSRFKGVYKVNNKYRAQIKVNGKIIYLGYFNSEVEAAHAYDEAAKLHFGEFAVLNFPQEGVERAVCE